MLVTAMVGLSFPAVAQQTSDQHLTPVTVSGSRFANGPESAPIGATVITADQIREAGINNVNEAIRKIGGVYGRQNLNGTSDFPLDLRGFGSASDQNVVIMIDGIRISENEQATALMSSISIESVERIEIVRGGSSVLYGEGATSGTIQIITKRGVAGATHGSLVAVVGNRNTQELRASLSKGWESFSIDANLSGLQTDNYRYNNALKQENFSGGMQWALPNGRIGMRVDIARQDSRLAGGLSWAQFLQNPQQANPNSVNNYGSIDSNRYTLFADKRFGNWEVAADLSHRTKTASSFYNPGPVSTYESRATQFSPRLRHVTGTGDFRNELTIGLDFLDSERRQSALGITSRDGSQQSKAIYARDEIRFGKARIAAGARHEKFDQSMVGTRAYDQIFSLNAADLQASYEFTPIVSLFSKIGRSYRVANIDENSASIQAGRDLKPQTSDDYEFGGTVGNDKRKLTAKLFRHKLTNEIYYDRSISRIPTGTGANVNLDPTEREGLEIEASTRLGSDFSMSAVLQHVSAKFTEGRYAGREMTLVPKNIATLRLNWLPTNGQSADVGVQWVDSQRYGGDFSNACNERIPSYAVFDARYAVRVGSWEFALSGTNLTDKDYFSQAFGTCRSSASIYTDAGRAVKLSARYDF